MPLFREPPPPPKPNETLGERAARLAQHHAPAPPGRTYVLLALGALAIGGILFTWLTGGGSVSKTIRQVHEKGERDAAKKNAEQPPADGAPKAPASRSFEVTVPPPAAPGADTAATDQPAPAVTDPPPAEGSVSAPDVPLGDFAAAARVAPAEMRPALRRHGLETFGKAAADARMRRAALLEAARWAPDATPEEADLFAKLTEIAGTAGLSSSTDAAAAVLYLGSLRDRGGTEAVIRVEKVVLDESRPMELRVAAARILPPEARPRIVNLLVARSGPHPALLSALK